jgi:hypothetical protein
VRPPRLPITPRSWRLADSWNMSQERSPPSGSRPSQSNLAACGRNVPISPGPTRPKRMPDYETSVGAMLAMLECYDGNEIGEPVKVAEVCGLVMAPEV